MRSNLAALQFFRTDSIISITDRILLILITGALLLCLLYTSDAADERSSVDLGGRRIIKKKNHRYTYVLLLSNNYTSTSN